MVESVFEIGLAMFAGYCCCYFISMELVKLKPQEVLLMWLQKIEKELNDK